MRNDLIRFLGAALLVLLALALSFKLKAILGWSPDLILPVLVAAAFFLDIYALALLVLVTVWIINWQAGLPVELLFLAVVPLAAWFGKKFLPSAPWLTLAALIAVGEVLLYAFAVPQVFFGNLIFILSNIVFAVLLGLGLLNLVEYVYGSE